MQRFDALGNIILLREVADAAEWDGSLLSDAQDRAREACEAARADQLLLVRRGEGAAWSVRVFNADGSRAGMCGNGSRCVVRHAAESAGQREIEIAFEDPRGTIGRRVRGRVITRDPFVAEVDMGVPEFEPGLIPVDPAAVTGFDAGEHAGGGHESTIKIARVGLVREALEEPLRTSGAEPWAHVVSVGNPHAILWCSIVSETLVQSIGPLVQAMDAFPQGINVHLAWVEAGGMRLESFERGSGYTRACASGACAAVVAGVASGRLSSGAIVDVSGGELDVRWHPGHGVTMRGGAERA